MWRFPVLVLLLLIPVLSPASQDSIAFVHANVVPMNENRILRDYTVVVSGSSIEALGPSGSTRLQPGVKRIDAKGKYLMPGLVDAHVHMNRKEELALFVLSGVTTVQGLGGNPERSKRWSVEIEKQTLIGPSYINCDTVAEKEYTPDGVREFVRKAATDGYSCIKFYSPPDWPEDVYHAFSDEAAKQKIRTVGHLPRNLDLKIALGGLGSVAHAEEYLYTYFNKLPDRRNEKDIPYAVELTKQAGLGVIPNLIAYHYIGLQTGPGIQQLLQQPENSLVLQVVLRSWTPEFNRYRKTFTEADSVKLLGNYTFLQKLVLQLQKAGVPLAVGSDTSSNMPFLVEGVSAQYELQELVTAGLTNYEALCAGTSGAAKVVGKPDEIGRIQKGWNADLVLLQGNPLEDVANVSRIDGVMLRGRWLDSSDLKAIRRQYMDWKSRSDEWMSAVLRAPDDAALRAAIDLAQQSGIEVDEEVINDIGYQFLQQPGQAGNAVTVMRFNTLRFPDSANAFDSLGEAYAKNGDSRLAIESYERSLRLNPENTNARDWIQKLKTPDAPHN